LWVVVRVRRERSKHNLIAALSSSSLHSSPISTEETDEDPQIITINSSRNTNTKTKNKKQNQIPLNIK